MPDAGPLAGAHMMGFIATTSPERARVFYRDVLGLRLLSEDPFALVFDARGVTLRVQLVHEASVAPYTALGWDVPDIAATAANLIKAGVQLDRYPGLEQDESGIWTSPSGARVAWFRDPEGHILSISQLQ